MLKNRHEYGFNCNVLAHQQLNRRSLFEKKTVTKNVYVILLQPAACNFTKKESVKYQRRIYDALKIYDRAFL